MAAQTAEPDTAAAAALEVEKAASKPARGSSKNTGWCGQTLRHGYAEFPTSRQRWCQKTPSLDCGPIRYEPQSVEGPDGFPALGPRDGELASANNTRFGDLDGVNAPNGKPWPTTKVKAGQLYKFTWCLTAPHSTRDFRHYLTKPGWDPSRPLARASFETEPFAVVEFQGGEVPDNRVAYWVRIPPGYRGRHVLYAVWDVADTGAAFYSACDLEITS